MLMNFLAVAESSSLLPMLLLLAILLVSAKLLGALSVRLGQPAVLGELLAGLLLGPSLLDLLSLPVLRSAGLSDILRAFAEIGVLCLMFAAGLETELDDPDTGILFTLAVTRSHGLRPRGQVEDLDS